MKIGKLNNTISEYGVCPPNNVRLVYQKQHMKNTLSC